MELTVQSCALELTFATAIKLKIKTIQGEYSWHRLPSYIVYFHVRRKLFEGEFRNRERLHIIGCRPLYA